MKSPSRVGERCDAQPAAVVVLATCASLVVAGWVAARGADEPELGALVDDVIAAGAPGVLVVARDGDNLRSEAMGFADGAHASPVTVDTRFRIGSVTKTFVATLVLMLVQDGDLELEDTVDQWLPGLIPSGRQVTVRQLLSHTSGLADYVEDPRVLEDPKRRWRPRELIELATGQHTGSRQSPAVLVCEHELPRPGAHRRNGRWSSTRASASRTSLRATRTPAHELRPRQGGRSLRTRP